MIRRIKSEVLHELPDKRRQQVFLSVTDKHTKVMKKVLADLRAARKSLHGKPEQTPNKKKAVHSDLSNEKKIALDEGQAFAARSDQKLLLLEAFADTGAFKLPAVTGCKWTLSFSIFWGKKDLTPLQTY